MKISDYMPNLYDKNKEMHNIIYSEEEELENRLKPGIENSFKDTFAIVATEKGIEKFEKILGIKADKNEDTLTFRRERVISRLISSIPFTEKYLVNQLNAFLGVGNWTYTLDYNNYSLVIRSLRPGKEWYREILDFLDRTIPCNIEYTIEIYAMTWGQIRDNFNTWQDLLDTDMTWEEVMEGDWNI